VGRIYEQVRQRPRYTVAALLEQDAAEQPRPALLPPAAQEPAAESEEMGRSPEQVSESRW
ncbi:MAG: hypothetical protein JOZ93_18390, partial [Sinobacteraceae bacterium]|nr:hypothetical protein [Nevskiaceae bacterium]